VVSVSVKVNEVADPEDPEKAEGSGTKTDETKEDGNKIDEIEGEDETVEESDDDSGSEVEKELL